MHAGNTLDPKQNPQDEMGVQEAPSLKRKKTVTWADGEDAEYGDEEDDDDYMSDEDPSTALQPSDPLFADIKASNFSYSAMDTSFETGVKGSTLEPLTTEELIARRSDRFMQLENAYEAEFWSLANELLVRSWSFGKDNRDEVTRTTRSRSKYADIGEDPEIAKALLDGGIQAAWETATAKITNKAVGTTTADAAATATGTGGEGAMLPTDDEISEFIMYLPRPDEEQIDTFRKHVVRMREKFLRKLYFFTRVEASAAAATSRELERHGAIAALCGINARYFIRRTAVTIGRGADSLVDVDLSGEGSEAAAKTVSRQQAQLFLDTDGQFKIRCIGRRLMSVNGQSLTKGQVAVLINQSLIRVGPLALMFVVNNEAVERIMKRSEALIVS